MPKFKDYYDVLGVPPRSHVRVIEETYWEQAHELQKQPTRTAARKLSQLNEAYEVLGSPHRRLKYDREMRYLSDQRPNDGRGGFLQLFVSLLGKPFRPD